MMRTGWQQYLQISMKQAWVQRSKSFKSGSEIKDQHQLLCFYQFSLCVPLSVSTVLNIWGMEVDLKTRLKVILWRFRPFLHPPGFKFGTQSWLLFSSSILDFRKWQRTDFPQKKNKMEKLCCHSLILQHKMQIHSNKTHCQSFHQKAQEPSSCKMIWVGSYFKYAFILFSGFGIKEMSWKPAPARFSSWPQKMHARLASLSSRSQQEVGKKKCPSSHLFSALCIWITFSEHRFPSVLTHS